MQLPKAQCPECHREDQYVSLQYVWPFGRRVQFPRRRCADCHWAAWVALDEPDGDEILVERMREVEDQEVAAE